MLASGELTEELEGGFVVLQKQEPGQTELGEGGRVQTQEERERVRFG